LLIDEVEKIVPYQNLLERRSFVESLRYFLFDGNCAAAKRRFFGNRNLIVADLDADALKNTLFELVGLEFEVSFWKHGSDFSLLPIENLGLLSLLSADQNWQTNLVEQYLARKER
jgi:hypothetical protein